MNEKLPDITQASKKERTGKSVSILGYPSDLVVHELPWLSGT